MEWEKRAETFLRKAAASGSVLGLSSMYELMHRLGDPQEQIPVIHVAGTNGKGSVCCFLRNILSAQGYRLGVYTSPAVFSYEERFLLCDVSVERQELCAYFCRIADICEQMSAEGWIAPTLFEIETAAAYLLFYEKHCDFAIIEVGMGGATDATNVLSRSLCSVFTSIGRDHMQFLGDSLVDIATVKAGIIKQGGHVVSIWQDEPVEELLKKHAKAVEASIAFAKESQVKISKECPLLYSYMEFTDITVEMQGTYQLDNSVLALETIRMLRSLGIAISDASVRRGIRCAQWPGRMECIHEHPSVYLDGAHNLPAARRMKETICKDFTNQSITYIIGVLADKEHQEMMQLLMPYASHVFTVTPANPRALSADALAAEIAASGYHAVASVSMQQAVAQAWQAKDDVIIAFGSLSYLQDFKTCMLQFMKEHENDGS